MFVDFIINEGTGWQGRGAVGEGLSQVRFDPGMLRPFIDENGHHCVMYQTGKRLFDNASQRYYPEMRKSRIADMQARGLSHPVWGNATTIRKEAWIEMDREVARATRLRLKAWDDLRAASTRGGFDAMGKMTLEYQAMTDPGEAVVDMDGITDARNDRPLFKLRSVPLPITHSDFFFTAREIAVSRNSGTPLDTTMAEAAGRRVAEMVEKTLIGVETGVTYGTQTTGYGTHDGTSTVYGYTNFPYRITKTDVTTPTGTNPDAIMTDLIEMRELLYAQGFFGPFIVYHSTGYDRYLDDDYYRSGGTSVLQTVRERIGRIEGITAVRRLDYLTSGYVLIMVQMTPSVAQAIDGMGIITVMWESQGGMRVNFKVMCIQVPLLKAPYNGVTGIVHGTTS